jgi:hypothetical protein
MRAKPHIPGITARRWARQLLQENAGSLVTPPF